MPDYTFSSRDGTSIAARDHGGDGPDVILLHGAMRNLEDWSAIIPLLDGMRVVAMDQRFHGHSGVGTTTDPAGDIQSAVDGLGLRSPFLVGHSMGGVAALLYAAEHPECRGVLDIDGYDFRQPEFYDELPEEEVQSFLEGFAARSSSFVPFEDEGDDAWLDQQVGMLMRMDAAWSVPEDVSRAVAARAFVPVGGGRFARRPPSSFWALATGETADLLGLLRRIACPVTVLVCTRPMPMSPSGELFAAGRRGVERHVRAVGVEHPNVSVATIDATHGVIYERPQQISELITSMVAS